MYNDIPFTPAEIAAATTRRRPKKADGVAIGTPHPTVCAPAVSPPIDETVANSPAQPITKAPGFVDPDCPPTYVPTEAVTDLCDEIRNVHKLRQGMIRAKNRIVLQAMASIRHLTMTDDDFADDAKKAKARKRNEDLYRQIVADPEHAYYEIIEPYLTAAAPLEAKCEAYAKRLAKLAKQLPVYHWAAGVKGFGDVSFATIVGEAGDIGTYKSAAALWKRMGVAVIGGKAQGKPGAGASADDWIEHGYRASRRSVMWNARAGLILGMGKWRAAFGEDVQANPDLTYFQRLFAERARLECEKLGKPVTCSDKGRDSYSSHAANRALRYCEKRLLKLLRQEWRKAALAA